MSPTFLNQHFIPHLCRMTVCKLAADLENGSDHGLPRQLNPCEVLS